MKTSFKYSLFFILISFYGLHLSAQKLPNKQEISLRAPVNIKIDGKATEWDNQFHAFNHATEVFYTISNDDNNLYLTIQAKDRSVISKILNGGISFTVAAGDKKDKEAQTITYPVFERNARPALNISKSFYEQTATVNAADSIVMQNNRRLEEKSKLIMVTGIKGIDTLISVYNDNDIKAAEKFDNKMAYTYELAVSLKHVGLSVNTPRFNYHIMLNGTSILPDKVPIKFKQVPIMPDAEGLMAAKLGLEAQTTAPTDFWGEYTLAKQ
ncbi:hypothetical protein [Mucilaginibacter boryungensis]|uniref:Uncharacterized protein n=1 Tax=Mucilaginibacter boryungensis TaxID=768480 RepID=A0ABR9XGA3_9SPHI|nr:hypothetical protein [Mucilaginibacter boryungensis]MBE9666301.1 hypothetical protein [Mucilaginibacter boryungensis]